MIILSKLTEPMNEILCNILFEETRRYRYFERQFDIHILFLEKISSMLLVYIVSLIQICKLFKYIYYVYQTMTKGISLHIGLNSVDPNHYFDASGMPWEGNLVACEYDAIAMEEIAKSSGCETIMLLTKDATVDNVKKKLSYAAQKLEPGDLFILSYSGHGGRLPDKNDDEGDGYDETWCLYDREFVDDELNTCLRDFKDDVRILSLSDSCHSGSVVRGRAIQILGIDKDKTNVSKSGKRYRFAPVEVESGTYYKNKEIYDSVLLDPKYKEGKPNASVILLSGCQDTQYSQDGAFNGAFTGQLLMVWGNGTFSGNIKKFYRQILNRMNMSSDPNDPQTPNYYRDGKIDRAFEMSKPFTI